MKLIVGLGNPGSQYVGTRHNMGFEVIDKFANSLGVDVSKKDFKGLYCKTKFYDEDIILLKPETFMNLSGESIQACASFYKIAIEDIYVVYDDLDFEPGIIKIKEKGSSAGHNGIKNIIQLMGSDRFVHVRVGTGKPTYSIIDYVLSKPGVEERKKIDLAQENAVEAIKLCLKENVQKAMSKFN